MGDVGGEVFTLERERFLVLWENVVAVRGTSRKSSEDAEKTKERDLGAVHG